MSSLMTYKCISANNIAYLIVFERRNSSTLGNNSHIVDALFLSS